MTRLSRSLVAALTLGVTACAVNLGGPKDIPVSAVALRAAANAGPDAVAAALTETDAALVTGPVDSTWLASVAQATGLTLTRPATVNGVTMAFLAGEPLGDTTVVLSYDRGSVTVHDALYELDDDRFLDLMIFQLDDPAAARPAVRALVEYMATDVDNSAAVVVAAAVPSAAAGDSVGRLLSPAYFDALRCEPGLAAPADRAGIRLFYGPEARVYCRAASAEAPEIGDVVRADLVLGRR